MLRITKYDRPEQTVIYEMAVIIAYLLKKRVCTFVELYDHVQKTIHGGDAMFHESICVLFALGKISYFNKNDSFILRK